MRLRFDSVVGFALAFLLAVLCGPRHVCAQHVETPNGRLAPVPIPVELWSPPPTAVQPPILAPPTLPQEEADQGSSWTKGLLIGGLIGIGTGVLAHAVVDGLPCDTCSDGGSAAEGARLEFALLFGVAGAAIGALIAL